MGFWAKSLRIFNAFCDNAQQSIRQVAHRTGLSKSGVHRLKQAMERRDKHPESWWWETEAGRCWFIRLVVATLYTFGLKRGVGAETISEFFGRLRLETHVGCSPSALSGVLHAGSHLRRDNVVSVLYSEGLNSTKSSVFLQRTDRHGIVGQKSSDFQRFL
jgi:hypothetical protein